MFSSSDEVYDVSITWNYFFSAWLITSVKENEPNLKETTVNYFALRHHPSIEVYSSEHSELVKQYARIVKGLLLYLLSKLPGMIACPTVFPKRFNLLCLA